MSALLRLFGPLLLNPMFRTGTGLRARRLPVSHLLGPPQGWQSRLFQDRLNSVELRRCPGCRDVITLRRVWAGRGRSSGITSVLSQILTPPELRRGSSVSPVRPTRCRRRRFLSWMCAVACWNCSAECLAGGRMGDQVRAGIIPRPLSWHLPRRRRCRDEGLRPSPDGSLTCPLLFSRICTCGLVLFLPGRRRKRRSGGCSPTPTRRCSTPL